MSELKLCPFCGEPGVLRRLINDLFVVCCKNEKCYMIVQNNVATTPEKAIEIWNTRPIENTMQKQINKLQKEFDDAKAYLAMFNDIY